MRTKEIEQNLTISELPDIQNTKHRQLLKELATSLKVFASINHNKSDHYIREHKQEQ